MITRRGTLQAGGIGLLVAHQAVRGQLAAPIRRIGVPTLAFEGNPDPNHHFAAFKQGMQDLGWIEGKSIEYRFAYANGEANHLDALARELIRQRVDVLLAGTAAATRAAQRVTRTVPIVMAVVGNAVGLGFVASLARPGGNITGITALPDEVLGKLIGALHEVAPGARRVAIVLNETNPVHPVYWATAQSACAALGLVALPIVANAPAELSAAAVEIARQRSQAVVFTADPVFLNEYVKVQELMLATRLPVAYPFREHVVAGGLLSYSADLPMTFRHVATYADKILKGAKPADLPVEQVTKFELVLNLKSAKALGLTISQSLLLSADEVIR
jgi:putative ABC transport system substrate-binding protein